MESDTLPGPYDKGYGPNGIHNMVIFNKVSGASVIYRDYRSLDIDPNLASGMLSALTSFSKEALGSREGLKSFEVEDLECILENTNHLVGGLVVEPQMKKKEKKRYVDKMKEVMNYLWERCACEIQGCEDITDDMSLYVDNVMGFNYQAVKLHEEQLEEERKKRQIMSKMDMIEEQQMQESEEMAHKLNKYNGTYFIQAMRRLVEQKQAEMTASN